MAICRSTCAFARFSSISLTGTVCMSCRSRTTRARARSTLSPSATEPDGVEGPRAVPVQRTADGVDVARPHPQVLQQPRREAAAQDRVAQFQRVAVLAVDRQSQGGGQAHPVLLAAGVGDPGPAPACWAPRREGPPRGLARPRSSRRTSPPPPAAPPPPSRRRSLRSWRGPAASWRRSRRAGRPGSVPRPSPAWPGAAPGHPPVPTRG